MLKSSIVIVGGGIAGSAAAALLGRDGHTVTLLERAGELRTSGSPVDIRGEALDVVRRLGLESRLRAADTGVQRMRVVDATGRRIAETRLRREGSPDVELSRMELGRALADAAGTVADVRMGASPIRIETGTGTGPGAGRNVVHLHDGSTLEADLVIGADGQHSTVRRLLWGEETRFSHPIGLTIATIPVGPGGSGRDVAEPAAAEPAVLEMHNLPGVSLSVHPAGGHPVAAFILRTGDAPAPANRAARERLLRDRYAGMRWRAPQLLDRLADAPDLYYDTVTRVATPAWSHGTVALLGDAASSITILGEGSSMAVVGAAVLADALREATDLPAALAAYEGAHRSRVEGKQRGARLGAGFLVPASRPGLALRNLAVRLGR